jgi:hypothetical protein
VYVARANQAKENRDLNFDEEDIGSAKHNEQNSVDYEDFGMIGGGGGPTSGKVHILFP